MDVSNSLTRYFDIGEKPKTIFEYISLFTFLLIAFTLPLSNKIPAILIIISVVNMFVSGNIFRRWKFIFSHKLNIILVSWYILHFISIIYSENTHYALKDLETKLSFLLFPLLIFSASLTSRQLRIVFLSFIAGCLTAAITCLAKAIGWYQYDGIVKHFLYLEYSYFMHATYFSFYLNFAVLYILYEFDTSWVSINTLIKGILIIIAVYFLITITQLNGRTASAASYITILLYAMQIFNRRGLVLKGFLFIFTSVLFFGFLQYQVFRINTGRLKQITDVIQNQTDVNKSNSTTIRMHLWLYAFELIKEQPLLGVGIGDIKEELLKKYVNHKYRQGIRQKYSPHDQYIHTTVILGLVGLFLLLTMLLIPFYLAWKARFWLYFYFIILIGLNGLTESHLEVQKGVIFFAMMNAILYYLLVTKQTVPDREVVVLAN